MKNKVSDYIAEFLAENKIKTVFTVVGGGAMHLNDSLGHHPKLHCVYNHHEQASAIAAEAYFRVNGKMACCCVTSGPGAVNALNGVVGAYQDSIPMIVLSGQCKTSLMARSSGLSLRSMGNQEYDIVPTLMNATKYAESVAHAEDIRYCLEKALYLATNGRPGPCWLEVPLDIQGSYVEEDILRGYTPVKDENIVQSEELKSEIEKIYEKIIEAKRPVIYAGNGIRIAGAVDELRQLAAALKIPVVTGWVSIDLMDTDNPYYCGRAGIMGDRAGNFAVQNSDLVLAIGNRLSVYQVGYQIDLWAREAYIIDVDIDAEELKKPTIRVDMPVCADAKEFLSAMLNAAHGRNINTDYLAWNEKCLYWKKKYPVVSDDKYEQKTPVNVYAFMDRFSRRLDEDAITVVANGSASVVGSATYFIKKHSRFIMNCAFSSMGYDLPAAVGACIANDSKEVVCIAGDGSIMMNLQELQTIVTNGLPVKIVLINNQGYHQIRLTQTNLFNKNFVGIGPQSSDLGFPEFKKIADAFGIPYVSCDNIDALDKSIDTLMGFEKYGMLEVFCDTTQIFEPKSATRRLEDGTLVSPPLEDLYPFLDRDELKNNMIIKMIDEE